MNITYRKEGDYLIPDWTVPENWKRPLGLYGRMRKQYLQENRPGLYTRMVLDGTLYDHLLAADRAARERLDYLLPLLAAEARATEALKTSDPMKWVGIMNTCKAQAEETIQNEIVYE